MKKEEFAVNFWKNLKTELRNQHRTYKWLCEEVGINSKTLSSMISRKTCPDIVFLIDVCELLHIDTNTLIYGKAEKIGSNISITDEEKQLIQMLRSGSLEEYDKAISLFVSVLKDVYGQEPCWQWNNKIKQFCYVEATTNNDIRVK